MIEYIIDGWHIITTVVTVASAIATITPTKKDDAIMAKVNKLISLVALNIGNAKRATQSKRST